MTTKITQGVIDTDAIGPAQIQADAIAAAEIATDAVGAAEIATDAVGSAEIVADAVAAAEIAADAVGSSEIAANAVDSAEIAANAVGSSEMATGSVAADEIAANAVGTSELEDGGVANADVAAGFAVQTVNTQTGVVSTGTTVMPADDTIPQNTEGDEYMTLAITPKSATNKLKIDVVFQGTISIAGILSVALFQDSTADALAAAPANTGGSGEMGTTKFTYYMTAGTASATTFKVRAGPSGAGTTTFNGTGGARRYGGVAASSITITEIKV